MIRKLFILSVIIIFQQICIQAQVQAQQDEESVKASLIYYFISFVNWPNENKIDQYTIGVFSQNKKLYDNISKVSRIKMVKTKPIKVVRIDRIDNIPEIQVLYVGSEHNHILSSIYDSISSKNILLISDNSQDRLITMINFVVKPNESQVEYEANKSNLRKEGFTYKNELLLYGGSHFDIKELLTEAENKLATVQETINTLETEIGTKEKELKNKNNTIDSLFSSITIYQAELERQTVQFHELSEQILIKQELLQRKNRELLKQKQQQQSIIEEIQNKKTELENAQKHLTNLKNESASNQEKIAKQTQILSKQADQILTQKRQIYLVILLLLATLFAGITIFRSYQLKKRLSIELEQKVDLRTLELKESQLHSHSLFEHTPVATIEFDFSKVNKFIDQLNIRDEDSFDERFLDTKLLDKCIGLFRIIDVNNEALKLFHLDKKELLKNGYFSYAKTDSKKDLLITLKNIWKGISQLEYETIRQTATGQDLYLIIRWVIFDISKLDYSNVLLTLTDITRLKEYEDELRKHRNHLEELVNDRTAEINLLNKELQSINEELYASNDKLLENKNDLEQAFKKLKETQDQLIQSEKMATIGMLTAGIAHEINNPINFISSGSQLLFDIETDLKEILKKDDTRSSEILMKLDLVISSIKKGVERTTDIITSLRNYLRYDGDVFIKHNILSSLHDALLILQNTYKDKIQVHEQISDVPMVECIPGKIYQVFVNLLSNAVDSIDEQGDIYISISCNADKSNVEVCIKDTGSGIDKEILPIVFDPFFTTKEVGKGTGLGLYIVYGIIQQHNGEIKVESTKGKGTTFIISLPVEQDSNS